MLRQTLNEIYREVFLTLCQVLLMLRQVLSTRFVREVLFMLRQVLSTRFIRVVFWMLRQVLSTRYIEK